MGLAVGLALLVIVVAGCHKKVQPADASPSGASASRIDIDNLQCITATEEKERDNFRADIRSRVQQGDFNSLEAQATDYRSNKSRFPNGCWKLQAYYVAFGELSTKESDAAWLDQIKHLQQWAAQATNSITPLLALAEAYRGYGWFARGSDFADKVTDEGSRLLDERLGQSFACLRQAKKLLADEPDSAFYAIALRVCLGANVKREVYEKIFADGVAHTPDYTPLYEYKAYYLLPRWYGATGEWETFARAMSRREDIPGSGEIFARCALHMRDFGLFYEEFSATDDSWNELKTSFHALEADYPDSLEIKSVFCLISAKLCDYQEARAQMQLLHQQVDLSVWGTQDNFVGAAQWLNQDDATLESARQQFKSQKHSN